MAANISMFIYFFKYKRSMKSIHKTRGFIYAYLIQNVLDEATFPEYFWKIFSNILSNLNWNYFAKSVSGGLAAKFDPGNFSDQN